MRFIIIIAALLAGTQTAVASSNFSCSAKDRAVTFDADAVVSHGNGEHISNFKAELEIRAPGIPDDLRKIDLGGEYLTQKWYHRRELKLRMYREREGDKAHGNVELVVETRRGKHNHTAYIGSYTLTVYDLATAGGSDGKTTVFRGRVSCSGE